MNHGMNFLDWAIIIGYMLGLILLSIYLGKGQENQEDYYVGGRNLPWWAVGISTMATQLSAISFVSIPAFVALEPGGGLSWLQYELAVPLAMIFIMIFFIPFFRKLELISIYEYLEGRFNSATRTFLSAVFLVSRGLATGVSIYMAAVVLKPCLGIELWGIILIVGVVTIIYDTIGGMSVVVYSDVIQMVILLVGTFACVFYAMKDVGGWSNAVSLIDQSRLMALDFSKHGLGDGGTYPFWGFLIGGFFLYASYYGCDQSQAQRELSAPSTDATKYSLMLNGFCRFPLVAIYIVLGIAVGAFAISNPDFLNAVKSSASIKDSMLPTFIVNHLPHGVKALILAAILSAAFSSLDSALNSLSASTMRDYIEKWVIKGADEKKYLLWSKITTVSWGIIITGFAFLMLKLGKDDPAVVTINKIGSAFYGPILAAFLLGVASRRITGWGVISGIIAGVVFNMILWAKAPNTVFWMWWNFLGLVVTIIVAYLVSLFMDAPSMEKIKKYVIWEDNEIIADEKRWMPRYALLVAYFVGLFLFCYFLPQILSAGAKAMALLIPGG